MNKAILIGVVCNDPEAFTTQSGIIRSTFRIAVQRKFKNADGKRDADFLTIVAWRNTAEFCNKYLAKGRKVAVEGSIQTRSYDAQDGSKRYVTEIIADNVEALTSANADNGPTPPPSREDRPAEPEGEQFTEVDDDSLPFLLEVGYGRTETVLLAEAQRGLFQAEGDQETAPDCRW